MLDEKGDLVQQTRVGHVSGTIADFLSQFPEGTPVALETVGNGHIPAILGLILLAGHRTVWIVDEIEASGCIPLLAHAAKAKVIIPRPTTKARRTAAG